ncbi:MAG: hypothetical protein WCK89_23105 [bacterium]
MKRTEAEINALEILHDVWSGRAQGALDEVLVLISRSGKAGPNWDSVYESIETSSVCAQFRDDLWIALCGPAFGARENTQQHDLLGLLANWEILWGSGPAEDNMSYRSRAARQCIADIKTVIQTPTPSVGDNTNE